MLEYLNTILQSKNAIMFITSIVFMIGILSYFNDCEILTGAFVMLFAVVLIIRNRISLKYVILWVLVFYLGFFNASLRVKNTDALFNFAPIDGVIAGRVVSIPNTVNGRTKFFFDVSSIDGIGLNAKTYVTVDGKVDFNIGDNLKINSKIRRPFKAGNPSQFDYGRYLRNFNAFTTSYAKTDGYEILNTDMPLKWKFMQKLNKIRTGVLESHAKYLKSPNLEILGGIVFGDDAVAPPDYIKTTFVNSGLLHILAASGMNVAFIFAFWFMIMKFFKCPVCGKIVAMVNETGAPTMCCGKVMEELVPNTMDGAHEKHIPVFEVKDNITDYEDAFKNSETFKHLKNVLKGAGFIIDDWNISYETN